MNPDKLPHCECERDLNAHGWKVRYFNCNDEDAKACARKNRAEQIEKQLVGRSGLTNRERRNLARERNFLQRHFTSTEPTAEPPRKARKLKAMEKKLRWLGRKVDRESV
jgi:hypothetical protein